MKKSPKGKVVWNLELSPDAKNVETDSNACTAHALAQVLNCPLHTAQTITFCAGRKQGAGTYSAEIILWCNNLFPGMFKERKGIAEFTVKTLAFTVGEGRFFVKIHGHALAVIDNKIVDTACRPEYSENQTVMNCWELERTEVTAEMLISAWKNLEF